MIVVFHYGHSPPLKEIMKYQRNQGGSSTLDTFKNTYSSDILRNL